MILCCWLPYQVGSRKELYLVVTSLEILQTGLITKLLKTCSTSQLQKKQKRKQLERRWRNTKSEIDRDLFKKQRLLVSQMIANAKHLHYHQKSKDQKQLFKVVEALLHQKRKPKLPSCDSVEELTDSFNNFFTSKIIRIRETLYSSDMNTHYSSNQSSNQICDSLLNVFTPALQDEVPKLILSSPSKSCDLDSLPTWMLKIHLDTLLPVITKIVNLSLDTASFPSTFKNALVTTLLKKPNLDSNNFKIFCPVSNLNFVVWCWSLFFMCTQIMELSSHGHS